MTTRMMIPTAGRPAAVLKGIFAALSALLFATTIGAGTAAAAGSALPTPLRPVAHLDIDRYLGQWWQLAVVPSFFNLQCAKDTNATYTPIDATTIGVNNRCTTFAGTPDGVTGQAKVLDTVTNAQLAVSFTGMPNLGSGNTPNYIVAWLADGASPADPYRYAIVGDPTRLTGFLLSRDKVIPTAEFRRLRTEIEKVGYNSCRFLVSPTTGGRTDYSPLCTV